MVSDFSKLNFSLNFEDFGAAVYMDIHRVGQTSGEIGTELVEIHAKFAKPVDGGDLNELFLTLFHPTPRRAPHGP
jgi:hypothetical protein